MNRRVVILGGGVAGLEALLAVRDLAGDRAEVTVVASDPDFVYKPMMVEEPFDLAPAEQYALAPLTEELGAGFVQRAVSRVHPDRHAVELEDGSDLAYDFLVVCAGGRFRAAFADATTFPSGEPLRVNELFGAGEGKGRVAFVVPPGVTWVLPIYEIALMAQRRAVELRLADVELTVFTPEEAPLAIFGPVASAAVGDVLSARGIKVETNAFVHETDEAELIVTPGDRRIAADAVIALPTMDGPAIGGLPADDGGFIPIDEHARVPGVDDVYAAGDGTTFPVKQGGLATQQADAAAAHIAHRLGAAIAVEPFRPVLRGKLLTGEESIHLRADVAGGGGEGEATLDALWWPPQKISGRYLASWIAGSEPQSEPEPPGRSLDVEVALPHEWHREPMALDPYGSPPDA